MYHTGTVRLSLFHGSKKIHFVLHFRLMFSWTTPRRLATRTLKIPFCTSYHFEQPAAGNLSPKKVLCRTPHFVFDDTTTAKRVNLESRFAAKERFAASLSTNPQGSVLNATAQQTQRIKIACHFLSMFFHHRVVLPSRQSRTRSFPLISRIYKGLSSSMACVC